MLKTLGKTAYYAFLGGLGLIALAILSTLFPIPGNFQILVVQSGSMEPAIQTGSVVIIRPSAQYKEGEVITFVADRKPEAPITHRIVEEQAGSFVTKGDANENMDPTPVDRGDVLGKVLLTIPYFGYVLDFAKQPLGFALIIGVPAAVIIGDEIRKIFIEARRLVRARKKKQNV